MKILALHGLHQKNSPLIKILKNNTQHTIIAPTLDPWKPIETYNALKQYEGSVDLVIGFSLGGLFAACLNIPNQILINPALVFAQILEERRKPNFPIIKEYKLLPLLKYPAQTIKGVFSLGDSKVGLRSLPLYREHYGEDTIVFLQGKHDLTEEQINNEILKLL
jgi:hypothetical protein